MAQNKTRRIAHRVRLELAESVTAVGSTELASCVASA
jgi:hypothetical protein